MAGLEGLRRDVSFDDFLARSRAEPVAREAARRFVESFHGADAGRISAKSIAGQEGGGGWRLAGGYDALFDALRRGDGARLRLGAVVTSVRWRRGDVELGLRSGATVRARTCLLTLPLPILQRQTVRFEPALRAKFAALRGLAMGSACRVTALLPGRLEQPESFFMDPGSDFPVWWSQGRGPWTLLTAWAGGPRAALLAGAGREAVLDAARFSLARLLGRIDVRSFHYHDWDADPFSLGAYSYALVGSNGARKALAEPLEDTLFFAGEATDVQGNEATVEGAIASGLRAAKELTSRLARCS
jgi:monoamine oxidase